MAINATTLGDLLKRLYGGPEITILQNLTAPIFDKLGTAADATLGGKGLYFPVNASGDEGYGFIDENAKLPDSQNEQVVQAVVPAVVFVGQVRLTGLANAIAARDPLAFANAYQYHTDMKLKRMMVYREGALFRDGTGLLGTCDTAVAVVVADTTTTAQVLGGTGTQWMRRNMLIDVRTGVGGPTKLSNIKITNVDRIANSIMTDVNIGTGGTTPIVNGDFIYLAGTQPATGTAIQREFLGLEAAIATTGTYLTIQRANLPEWQSNVVDAGNTDLDEDRLLQAENRVLIVGGLTPNDLHSFDVVIHPNQRRKYFELVVPQKMFTGMSLDAGYQKLQWNGHDFTESHNVPQKTVYMGDLGQFQHFVCPDGDLKIDDTFGPPIKWAQGFDAGVSYWRCYDNYAVRKPNAWVKIINLNNPGSL